MTPAALALGASAALVVLAAVPGAPGPLPLGPSSARPPTPLGRAGWRPTARSALAVRSVVAALVALVLPPLGLALLLGPPVHQRLGRLRAARVHAAAVARALPEAVDLLLLCTGAGLSLPLALPLVAERAPDPVGAALRAAEGAVTAGRSRSDATAEHLGALGDPAASVAHVLVDHLRYGVPLGPGLERAGFELRLARRRHAEEAARRLPVRLLAPLLLCVLPAFVLLTVVPLLVAALRSLPR